MVGYLYRFVHNFPILRLVGFVLHVNEINVFYLLCYPSMELLR